MNPGSHARLGLEGRSPDRPFPQKFFTTDSTDHHGSKAPNPKRYGPRNTRTTQNSDCRGPASSLVLRSSNPRSCGSHAVPPSAIRAHSCASWATSDSSGPRFFSPRNTSRRQAYGSASTKHTKTWISFRASPVRGTGLPWPSKSRRSRQARGQAISIPCGHAGRSLTCLHCESPW